MAGKFLNTSTAYSQMTNNLTSMAKSLLDNPYYLYTDKKATECTYYNINTTMSTLDEATRGNYAEISTQSPLRFNKIKNFLVYGLTRIEPNLSIGEYGVEGDDVTGEVIILPKTIIPYPGDYFFVTQLGKDYLFNVTEVNPNTLDTGATLYRANYRIITTDGLKNIEPQVVKRFVFSMNTGGAGSDNGSNLSTSIIDEETAETTEEFDKTLTALKDYYIALFYQPKVETFIYNYQNWTKEWHEINGETKGPGVFNMNQMMEHNPFGVKVYDPYLIEFIIRNGILSGSSTYLHVMQKIFLPSTFALDYDRTIFSSIEEKNIEKHYTRITGNLIKCEQKLSILYQYPEDYFVMRYHNLDARFFYINIFDDPEFCQRVKDKNYYNEHPLKNIIIKYFNGEEITTDDLSELDHIDYMNNKEFYYGIPLAIFCIEKQMLANLESVQDYVNYSDDEVPSQITYRS